MSKAPDLSAFQIPRKGVARPIEAVNEMPQENTERGGATAAPVVAPVTPSLRSSQAVPAPPSPTATPQGSTGRLLATAVKLDEDRYLRLQEADRPMPGRLRRRAIQDILTEALAEWLAKRGL